MMGNNIMPSHINELKENGLDYYRSNMLIYQ